MKEKRKSRRLPVKINLTISDLFNQDNSSIKDLDSNIEVINVSKNGIGFVSECVLPDNFYFNAEIELDCVSSTIYTVVKIIRSQVIDKDNYMYGAVFDDISSENAEILEKFSSAVNSDCE
ncbi:PilZ domain-containing protein [Acetitomaculum ruminis DSM 5522]|uniref:PilZ domain-containing protein n=1 Tax=Acetitomaculum ruminis DSM 5522 TaxID=1120918 RepID=A0A1I0XM72_9FIRM|nr:PilZ domain-containing protein [Acetitomaculum ruminis]SFB02004.1 PilZ domain-containing protein [Acetitomaculum ruminis DSM 5522]